MNPMNSTTPKYRILHLAYTFIEDDYRVMRYLNSLREQSHEVELICLRRKDFPGKEWQNGVKIYRIQKRVVNESGKINYLLRMLKFFLKATIITSYLQFKKRYNIIHIHNVPDFLVFCAWLPKLLGTKIILDIHDIMPELYASKFRSNQNSIMFKILLLVERASIKFADHVIVGNDIWKERLISRADPPYKCTAIINYPDITIFRPQMNVSQQDGKFIILYPGSLNAHQGLDVAIRAFNLIKGRIPGAIFYIYGDGPALPSLKALVKELNLENQIIFKDPLPLTEIADIMQMASIGVIPKLAKSFGDEAFSTKSMEFMACGIPIIMSKTKIDSYYFTDKEVRFFPSGDHLALADAIWEVYSRPEEARKRVEAALSLVSRENWQSREHLYLNIIDNLITKPL
jgi:glycosyltransferase involved in cell wall biosynthesis